MKIKVTGVDEVLAGLAKMGEAILGSAGAACYEVGAEVYGTAVRQVPIETGRLSLSGHVTPPKQMASGLVRVEVGFDTPYAEVQHEDDTFSHQPGRKAHYLSDPFQAMLPRMADIMRPVFELAIEQKVAVPAMVRGDIPSVGPYDRGDQWQKMRRKTQREAGRLGHTVGTQAGWRALQRAGGKRK